MSYLLSFQVNLESVSDIFSLLSPLSLLHSCFLLSLCLGGLKRDIHAGACWLEGEKERERVILNATGATVAGIMTFKTTEMEPPELKRDQGEGGERERRTIGFGEGKVESRAHSGKKTKSLVAIRPGNFICSSLSLPL